MSKIQNVVSTASLGCKLDLTKIARGLTSICYNPGRFGAAVLRHRRPHGTVLIFHTGKIVVTGTKSVAESKKLARIIGRKILKLGFPVKFGNFNTQLVVGSFNTGFRININELRNSNCDNATYEPELFAAVVYRLELPHKICVLIFHTGKGIITGAKEEAQIEQAYQTLLPIMKQHEIL